jgi:hypothetical protein
VPSNAPDEAGLLSCTQQQDHESMIAHLLAQIFTPAVVVPTSQENSHENPQDHFADLLNNVTH